MEEFLSGGNIWTAISAGVAVLSLLWNVFQQKSINEIKSQINLKNSGYVGNNAKAGGDIVGRDKK